MDKKTIKYITNVLRQASISWEGRTECLNRGRRKRIVGKLKDGRDETLWENNCESCNKWFLQKDNMIEVDHIVEIGPYKGDLHEFANRIFCEQSNLQRLCIECHKRKTSNFNATLTFKRKEKKGTSNKAELL